MMRIIAILLVLTFSVSVLHARRGSGNKKGHTKTKKKVTIYKYKKYERFDFEDMMVEGESGVPGDLTITPRFQRYYKNALPVKENFNQEIENAIESIN